MTTNVTDGATGVADDEKRQRYANLTLDSGEYVIYDRQNHRAWLQSSVTVDTAARR
jgi:hypothetical protein